MSELTDIWADRRVRIGYETAEELAHKFNDFNWRGHPESQADALDDSLEALHWVGSVKVNISTNRIFDGHLRVKRALVKNPSMPIPVDYYDLTEDEELLALQIHDAITEQAEPIPDKLAALLERARAMTADRPGLGAMLQKLKERAGINGNGSAPPELPPMVDKAEELQAKWQVKAGDLFEFPSLTTPGRFHRLLCGDCREPADLMRLTDGQQVNGCFTSPPYAEQRKQQYGGVPVAEYVEWWGAVQTNVRSVLAGDGSFFVNIKPHTDEGQRSLYVMDLVLAMSRAWHWSFVDEFCWLRGGVPREVKYSFKNGFEPVYHFAVTQKGFKFYPESVRHYSDSVPVAGGPGIGNTNWAGKQGQAKNYGAAFGRTMQGHSDVSIFGTQDIKEGLAYPSNVLKASNNDEGRGHQAAFPESLPTFFLKAYSDPGDIWLDPFLGSGTTICAAENEGRIGMGIERLEKYTAVCLERLSQLTGQTPRRVSGL